jgi:nitrate reductase assembly molybdenum cofactor insertion protein NarJ
MKSPYTREEIIDILALVADRLRVRDRWEHEAWYCRAYKKTRELRENITRRNMQQGRTRGRLMVTLEEIVEQKREASA